MKRALAVTLILIVALLLLGTPSQAAQGANIVGSWDITVESPQGKNQSLLVIKKDGEKLGGTIKGARGERPLESVALNGSNITFVVKANIQGQDMVFTYKGKVEKDSMKGDADFGGFATGTWSAVPHKEGDAAPAAMAASAPQADGVNITGDWSVTVETSAGSGNPGFTFKQEGEKLTGMYKGQLGEGPLTGTVKGADINFTIKVNAQGQDLTIVYSGKIESKDSMKGKVVLGELGEGTWTGKRK
ncbi:MAG TPA: hypothetical protein VI837_10655 [Blastocatellia bacterium]|nr:hypothetical protein [Blastocatellia bacterium]